MSYIRSMWLGFGFYPVSSSIWKLQFIYIDYSLKHLFHFSFFFFLRFYLFTYLRERECVRAHVSGGRGRGRGGESQADSSRSAEPEAGLSLMTPRSWPESKRSLSLNQLGYPGTPQLFLFVIVNVIFSYFFYWLFSTYFIFPL